MHQLVPLFSESPVTLASRVKIVKKGEYCENNDPVKAFLNYQAKSILRAVENSESSENCENIHPGEKGNKEPV